jgi:hypothetical protein
MITLWRSAKPVRLITVRRGRRFGYVASIGLPITNHFSPLTSDSRTSGLPVRFQDLFLAFSPGVSRLAFRTRPRGRRTRPRKRSWDPL